MKTHPEGLLNWRRIDPLVTTSGQPTTAQLAELADAGVTEIVNLGLTTHEMALPDEAGDVARLGMTYRHVPVIFANPTAADFALFCAALAATAGQRTHVHCIMNWRVSAFFYLYRVTILGWDEPTARRDMESVWTPDPIWTAYLSAALAASDR